MKMYEKTFHRLFALSMFKTLKMPLGEMTFSKDFVNDSRGDLYPIIAKSHNCKEYIKDCYYTISEGSIERMIGQFFPYATYELTYEFGFGHIGFTFYLNGKSASIVYNGSDFVFSNGDHCEYYSVNHPIRTLIISCRPTAFDVYSIENNTTYYITTFHSANFAQSHSYEAFSKGYVSVKAAGQVTLHACRFYIDCGISQADIRPIRYENGNIMYMQGKIYLTASIRMQKEMFQGVFSWVPGTQQFELTGAIFYDSGDGKWCGDVAASVLFNRKTEQWYLWVCSFNHDHILGHSIFEGDPRFGINVVDLDLMPVANDSNKDTDFLGVGGDEDPDFFFDESNNRWLMAVCRLDSVTKSYRYVFFESPMPFSGYTYIGCGNDGAETGGSFVRINGELHFVCGNSYEKKSEYRIYSENGMHLAHFDFPDGGFRGWGTLMPIKLGSRTRYFWLTFDRHNGSSYNWSYGNLYCFEAIM